jgi:hypothetical protein
MGIMRKIGSFFQGSAKQVNINSEENNNKRTPPLAAYKMNKSKKKK